MVQPFNLVNRALQVIGTRTSVTANELATNGSNEAIQANICFTAIRDKLIGMAPWNFALKTVNMVVISAAPGTPENPTTGTNTWIPGLPVPPWAYEYQYPVDCLRALLVIPSTQTGFAGGIPITTAVTGGAPSFWLGPPVKFKVQVDQFLALVGVTPLTGGTGYAFGDYIFLNPPPNQASGAPGGAGAVLSVTAVGAGGSVTAAVPISQVGGEDTSNIAPFGGSYFAVQLTPFTQASTLTALLVPGAGSGATFQATWGGLGSQRVILCNQEFATLTYVAQQSDPNVWDANFQEAFINLLGAQLCASLREDIKKANYLIQLANNEIVSARTRDSNEGLTVNDITPDFIRVRGIDFPEPYGGPFTGYDWGGLWPVFG